jgi:pyridoxamine 5'-phosphate oxidase
MPFSDLRRSYDGRPLRRAALAADPLEQIALWLAEARDAVAGTNELNAMSLATADAAGRPSVRMVLLKEVDPQGLTFFTNQRSRKADEIAATGFAALCLHWAPIYRQVRVVGRCAPVDRGETEAYFGTRPRGSQISAWASEQSAPVADRAALEQRIAAVERRFAGEPVPAPPFWGGYRVVPDEVELWQGRPDRSHDRFLYRRDDVGGWGIERLQP